jgi:bud emergence protein 1
MQMFLHKEKVKPPRSLRSARLSVVKNQISTPVIQASVASPKKVIKALYDYQAQSPNELSFARGDFFLVTARETDANFYEAFNPITNSRGIVPVPYFQVLEKHEKAMVDSAHSNQLKDEGKST